MKRNGSNEDAKRFCCLLLIPYLSEFAFAGLGFWTKQWHGRFTFARLLAAHARAFHLPNFTARNLNFFLKKNGQTLAFTSGKGQKGNEWDGSTHLKIAWASSNARKAWYWFGHTAWVLKNMYDGRHLAFIAAARLLFCLILTIGRVYIRRTHINYSY